MGRGGTLKLEVIEQIGGGVTGIIWPCLHMLHGWLRTLVCVTIAINSPAVSQMIYPNWLGKDKDGVLFLCFWRGSAV